MAELSYPIIKGDVEKHLMAVAQICSDTYSNGKYVKEISESYMSNCHYDWDVTRLIWDGDTLAHHWGVWGYPMRVDGVDLKTAGIGAVVTREAYRKQGLMAAAAEASFIAMENEGYDLTVLRGKHYVKFGYARAWNYVTYKMKADELPHYETLPDYRLLELGDMDAMNALYNETHAILSGTVVRPSYRNRNPGEAGVRGWFNEDNQLVGYVRAVSTEDKKTLQCLEAAGDAKLGLAVLVDVFKQDETEYEGIDFFTFHKNHPILQILRLGAVIVEDRYFHNTGWRVRIVNLHSTLNKLIPALERRIAQSIFANWQGALQIDAGRHTATLVLDQGKITVQEGRTGEHSVQGGAAIARLLIGSDDPQEILRQESMICAGEGQALVKALFPNLNPMMSHWDEM